MEQSILKSVKKNLGLEVDYDVFDGEIITYTNTAFSTLNDLGVGPASGFSIEDDEAKWEDFLSPMETVILSNVKTYIYLRVRLLFDPPVTSYAIKAFDDQRTELEVRISMQRESTDWVDPMPTGTGGDSCV